MKRLTIIMLSIVLVLTTARAQDNPYGIDNVCFQYFNMAENLVDDLSNDAFDMANEALLKRALEVKDEKARTLYGVGRLKRACRIARYMDDRVAANELVEIEFKDLKHLARETGYMQYFFYGYELTQNYYVNTSQQVHAQTLLQEMMTIAREENNDYGLWQSQRYISILYLAQNDLLNARKYLREVIDIYEKTTDGNIRRQSMTRVCCDMADTYLRGSDSARFYYNKAEQTALLHADTIRFTYYKAQLAALEKQIKDYRRYRDLCQSDSAYFTNQLHGDWLFAAIEAIAEEKSLEEIAPLASQINIRQQLIYLRDLAIAYKREDVAAWIGTIIIQTLYADISTLNNLKTEEISAMMENNLIKATIDLQNRRIRLLWTAIGVLAAIAAALAALLISKKQNNQ